MLAQWPDASPSSPLGAPNPQEQEWRQPPPPEQPVEAVGFLSDRFRPGQLFRRLRSRLTAGRSEQKLEELQAQAAEASASFRPQYYLRAARLAASLGRDSQALSLYGKAIDGYLEAGRGKVAEVICRQVVESYPHVVRARRTLALIALTRDDADQAASLLSEYAETARQFGDEQLIRKSLRTMGLISEHDPVRTQAASELSALGDEAGARMVMEGEGIPHDELFGGAAGPWSKALHAALLGADEMRNFRSG